eukprot:CAMPEP_0206146780 /NCGR_PEP_ID=MMETSP1473-20131121/31409_1 /ASSEMBLY_ACC=CAM_ASM_001109 /TAXON_ID=1461547 /ORGANISM="Stichococcus sp, Strain RCC1054" /LENGTH=201 /DNA_ID=CAMNT_0053543473 /DNA_START=82 /DNA_END=687 /DNA_ORIENTATION=-
MAAKGPARRTSGGVGGHGRADAEAADAPSAVIGSQQHKDDPSADAAVPSPSAPSAAYGSTMGRGAHPVTVEEQEDRSGSGKSPSPPMAIPGRGLNRVSVSAPVVDDIDSTPSGKSPMRIMNRTSLTRTSADRDASSGNHLSRTSLTGKVGDYLRRQSAEGVHGSLDAVRKAGKVLTEKAHGDDKESTSNHATASIDPSLYY